MIERVAVNVWPRLISAGIENEPISSAGAVWTTAVLLGADSEIGLELSASVPTSVVEKAIDLRVREDKIAPIAALYAPMEKSMQALLGGYSKDELAALIDFSERAGDIVLKRIGELNEKK